MGGPVPLGYEVIDRKLIPVPEEAERVRTIMRRYLASRSANELIAQLKVEGIRTKVQKRTSGPHRGGIPFRRGSLFHLLKNPIYRGKIAHKGKVYEGEHKAIVENDLWKAVQRRLKEKSPPRRRSKNNPQQALLRGLLPDSEARPMVPTYATKGTRRYAYYETRKDLARPYDVPATRIGQGQLERHLIVHFTLLLQDEHALRRISGEKEGGVLRDMFAKGKQTASALAHDAPRQTIVKQLITSMQVHHDCIGFQLNAEALGCSNGPHWSWSIPPPVRKPFREAKLRIDQDANARPVDAAMIALLGDALQARDLIIASPGLSINQVAKRDRRCRKQLTKLVRLSSLSPGIIEAIVDGRTPMRLSRKRLLEADLPLSWPEQEEMFGLAD